MDKLIPQQPKLWQEAETNILKSQGRAYDQAIKILCELKEVAEYEDQSSDFEQKLEELLSPFLRRSALIRRLRAAGLMAIKG